MAFKVGDTVRLKSGGPLMTVSGIGTRGGNPNVDCVWFVKMEKYEGGFPPDALEISGKSSGASLPGLMR